MCLNRVIGRKVLQEDIPCYGIIELTENGDKTLYRKEILVVDSYGLVKADTSQIISANSYSISENDKYYSSGFHRFLNIEDAEKRKDGSNQAIRKYVIPKGTEIVIGKENEGYVVVTPILKLVTINQKGEKNVIHKLDNQPEYRRENV